MLFREGPDDMRPIAAILGDSVMGTYCKWSSAMFRVVLCMAFSMLCCFTNQGAQADQNAIGFGWNATQQKEKIYSVNLTSGTVAEVGVIPRLMFLSLGSYDFSAKHSAAVVLGVGSSEDAGSVFVVDPLRNVTLEFALPRLPSVAYQDTLIDPKDGNVYVIGFDSDLRTNPLYRVVLLPGEGRAQLQEVTTISTQGYSAGSPQIAEDGTLHLLSVSQADGPTGKADKSTYSLQSIPLDGTPATVLLITYDPDRAAQSSLYCMQMGVSSPYLLGYGSGKNSVDAVRPDGTTVLVGSTDRILGWSPGSQACSPTGISLLGRAADSSSDTLFSLDLSKGSFSELALTSSNLKVLYQYEPAPDSVQVSSVTAALPAPKRLQAVSRKLIAKCAATSLKLRRARSFVRVLAASRKVRFTRKGCVVSRKLAGAQQR